MRNGIADVAGVPPAVLRAFSRGGVEIEAETEAPRHVLARGGQAAALETRRAKDRLVDPCGSCRSGGRAPRRLGLDEERLRSLLKAAAWFRLSGGDRAGSLRCSAAPHGLTKRWSTFSRRDVMRAWCEALPAGATVTSESIAALADAFLASERCVALLPPS